MARPTSGKRRGAAGRTKPSATAIALEGELGIREAEQFRQNFIQALSSNDPVQINVAGVTAVDTSIVQILLAAVRTASRDGRDFDMVGLPESPIPGFLIALGLISSDATAEDAADALRNTAA